MSASPSPRRDSAAALRLDGSPVAAGATMVTEATTPGQSSTPPYAVVVVHYRDPGAIEDLVESTRHWDADPSKVVVVDNSGELDPGTLSGATLLPMGSNVGYGAAANRGVGYLHNLGYEYILILTQDCRLSVQASAAMVSVIVANADVAVAAPVLLYGSTGLVFSAGGVLSNSGRPSHISNGEPMPGGIPRAPHSVRWADGACLLVRATDFLAVGGFDESYFLYVEEIDLQVRLQLLGRTTCLLESVTASQEPGNYTLYFRHRNLIRLTNKFPGEFSPWRWRRELIIDSLRMLKRGRLSQPLWGLRGVIDAGRGRFGPPPSHLFRP